MNITLLTVTHKPYQFPSEPCYIPIQVGEEISSVQIDIQGDNTGKHISRKNKSFCELTALYWVWKNNLYDESDFIGLVHYRRFFKGNHKFNQHYIASEQDLLAILNQYECILPKKRNYWVETIYTHYKNAHFIKDLDITKQIIQRLYPEYISAFEKIMSGRKLHLYNMFVMKRGLFNHYCEWLFNILFQLEKEIDISGYDTQQQRVFGFIAERLFNVWILHNNIHYKALKVVNIEGENYIKKAINLLKRKFFER